MDDPITKTALAGVAAAGAGILSWPVVLAAGAAAAVTYLICDRQHRQFVQDVENALSQLELEQPYIDVDDTGK